MYTALTLALAAIGSPAAPASAVTPSAIITRWVRGANLDQPRVKVWLDRDDVYPRGEAARVYFKSDRDAYVTIVRIDTDGRMRILFPIDPWEDNWARGGRTFEVLGRDRDEAFRVDDYPGVGYVFAIASMDSFNYAGIIRGDHWDYRLISDGRVRGDPYVAVSDMADRIAHEGEYDYDLAEYHVERHYDYPRFVCYDCHTYASWRYWDPYSSYCSRFRIVIYDDWYFYPYGYRYGYPYPYPYGWYAGGTVIVRPYRPGPRYVFKDADPRNDYITRVKERPRGQPDDRRPTIERDRTSADVGGRGAIPTPVSPGRRTPDGQAQGGAPGDRQRPTTRPPSADGRPGPRDTEQQPRRRADPGRPNDPGTTPDAPRTSDGHTPPRRPSGARGANPSPGIVDRGSTPSREEPRRRESPRDPSVDRPQVREPSRAEPRREPTREAPAERPRSEPRAQSPPRSTGEPELKRRRPD
jgi:hypothetical protein